PLIGIRVKVLRLPYRLLCPRIVFVCCTVIFSVRLRALCVIQVGIFGLAGYLRSKLKLEAAPLLLCSVLGSLLENTLRRGIVLARGDCASFLSDPFTLVLLALSMIILMTAVLPAVAHRREEIPAADD